MAKLTLEELHAIRDREALKMKKRDISGRNLHVVVAMGTSGIENGAKLILDTFASLCEEKNLDNVIITQSGAVEGAKEPCVQIHTPSLGLVTYEGVGRNDVERIIDETLVGGKVLEDLKG